MKIISVLSVLVSCLLVGSLGGRLTVFKGDELDSTAAFPFIAFVTTDNFICTGSLVGPKKVLSAGHCVCAEKITAPSEYSIFFGDTNIDHLNKPYSVSDAVITTLYMKVCVDNQKGIPNDLVVSGFDMSMLTLTEAPKTSKMVAVGKLSFDHKVPAGTPLLLTGYGKDDYVRRHSLGYLKNGKLTASKCPFSKTKSVLYRDPICVRYDKINIQNAGGGDSGGPLMLAETKEVVGVVSGEIRAYQDSKLYRFDIYPRVSVNRYFIEKHL